MATVDIDEIGMFVEKLVAAIAAAGPVGIELFLKLESLLSLGPDAQANVVAAIKAGLAADEEAIAAIESWKQEVGVS
jgi:hypothetical protein